MVVVVEVGDPAATADPAQPKGGLLRPRIEHLGCSTKIDRPTRNYEL